MDHIVYLDYQSKELQFILNNEKNIILRGATGRKLPYGRVQENDVLYFVNNNGEGLLKAKAIVQSVFFSEKLEKVDSEKLVDSLKTRVQLKQNVFNRFRGKRYISIIEIKQVSEIEHVTFNKDNFSNMDDWLLVEDINAVL
jgi:hypothetical protein